MIDFREWLHTINPHVLEAVNLFVTRIKEQYGDKVVHVILFGSYARGDAGPESDVDIMVLTSDDSFDLQYALIGMGYDLFLEQGVLLSVKVMTREHYDKKQDYLFLKEVSREGVVVA